MICISLSRDILAEAANKKHLHCERPHSGGKGKHTYIWRWLWCKAPHLLHILLSPIICARPCTQANVPRKGLLASAINGASPRDHRSTLSSVCTSTANLPSVGIVTFQASTPRSSLGLGPLLKIR